MKIRLMGAELFHADRRTDVTQLIVAFRNFANARKREAALIEVVLTGVNVTKWRQHEVYVYV
jgi:hypothetical protein